MRLIEELLKKYEVLDAYDSMGNIYLREELQYYFDDELEKLRKENEGLHKDKSFYSNQWEKVSKENEELRKFNKNVKGVLESIGRPHLGFALLSMLDKANELLTKKG